MDLMVAIVRDEDAGRVTEALAERGYRSTRISTASGFLKMSNTTLLVAVESEQVEDVLGIVQANCSARALPPPPAPSERPLGFPPSPPAENKTVRVGGAVVFILEVKRCERL